MSGAGGPPLLPADLTASIVLLRHGESTFIVEGRFQGRADPPLSPRGERQAALAAERLASPGRSPALPIPPTAPVEIAHSPLRRAAATAEAVGAAIGARGSAVPIRAEPDLTEISQGSWEGRTRADIEAGRSRSTHSPGGGTRRARSLRAANASPMPPCEPGPAWTASSRTSARWPSRTRTRSSGRSSTAIPERRGSAMPWTPRRRPRRHPQGRRAWRSSTCRSTGSGHSRSRCAGSRSSSCEAAGRILRAHNLVDHLAVARSGGSAEASVTGEDGRSAAGRSDRRRVRHRRGRRSSVGKDVREAADEAGRRRRGPRRGRPAAGVAG